MKTHACRHHYHEFIGRVYVTTFCCRCGEFEDRGKDERPSPHFQYLDIVTRSYQIPPPGHQRPQLWKGLHERWSL